MLWLKLIHVSKRGPWRRGFMWNFDIFLDLAFCKSDAYYINVTDIMREKSLRFIYWTNPFCMFILLTDVSIGWLIDWLKQTLQSSYAEN